MPLSVDIGGGRTATIAELDLYDRAAIQRADRDAARAQKLADCRDAGLDAGQTYVEVSTLTGRRWGEAEWIAQANSTDGQAAILERAFERANHGRGRDLLAAVRWTAGLRVQVVAHVAGLDVTSAGADDPDPDGGDPADPSAGRPGPPTT